MRYFAHTPSSLRTMLNAINKDSLDEMFLSIPEAMRCKRSLTLPPKLDELRLKRELYKFYNPLEYTCFLGAGATEHFVPEWISQQLMRAEWYTSYTPYQAEASQGTLQAIFEFQSMVASLFGLDVANASMYDGATALTEALLLSIRATGKKTIALAKTVHPEYRETIHTYLKLADVKVVEFGFNQNGSIDSDDLSQKIKENKKDLASIAIQSPNFFGRLENIKKMAILAHEHSALLVGAVTDISAYALLPSMGEQGVDIAIGDGIGFLGGINLGGPGVGLFACKKSLLRQMPGRLVGMTTDKNEQRGFVLTLSTREQHIRREKATSNICTNHNLMALAFSMALSAYGKLGLIKLAHTNIKKTLYFRQCLKNNGLDIAFNGPHYNETVIKIKDQSTLEKRLSIAQKHKILAGVPLANFYKELPGFLLVSTTELHDDQDIMTLAEILSGVRHDQ